MRAWLLVAISGFLAILVGQAPEFAVGPVYVEYVVFVLETIVWFIRLNASAMNCIE